MCDIFKAAVRTELHVWKNTSMTGSWDSNIPRLCFQLSCKILLTLTVHNLNYKRHKIQNKRARTVCGPGQKDLIFFSFNYLVLTLTKAHNNTNIFPSFYLKFKILMTVGQLFFKTWKICVKSDIVYWHILFWDIGV